MKVATGVRLPASVMQSCKKTFKFYVTEVYCEIAIGNKN